MSTTRKELVSTIHGLMASAPDSKQLAESIASYLIAERRSKDVTAILRDLETLRLKQDGILEVTAISARPLSEAAKENIKALFDQATVIIHEKQDPALLGGVKVRAYDKQADYSVRTRLQRLKSGAL